jgi:hypothetical protein
VSPLLLEDDVDLLGRVPELDEILARSAELEIPRLRSGHVPRRNGLVHRQTRLSELHGKFFDGDTEGGEVLRLHRQKMLGVGTTELDGASAGGHAWIAQGRGSVLQG